MMNNRAFRIHNVTIEGFNEVDPVSWTELRQS